MPGPIDGDLLVVTKPKGIYKPADLPYALSIRINLGRYSDGKPLPTPGGGWELSYHQENADPADRDKAWANRGLMRCIDDRIPVGVLRELGPKRHPSQYEVLGLAALSAGRTGTSSWRASTLQPLQLPTSSPMSSKQPRDLFKTMRTQRLRPPMTTTPGCASTGRLLPVRGSRRSGPCLCRPIALNVRSQAAMQQACWKRRICGHTAARTRTWSPTGSCCAPTFIPCSICAC